MATVSKEFVLSQMVAKRCMCYYVKDGNTTLGENDDFNVTPEAAADELKAMLKHIRGSHVTITISNKNKQEKGQSGKAGLIHIPFTVELSAGREQISGNNDFSIVQDLIKQNLSLEKQLIETKHANEMAAFQKRIEDLENGSNSVTGIGAIDKLLENENIQVGLVNMLGNLLSGGKQVVALAGVNSVTELIERIEKVDPDFVDVTFPILVQLAESKPDTYQQGITFLKGSL